jgi:hypothetical protein
MLYFPTEAPKTRELGSDINMLPEDPSLPYAFEVSVGVLCIEQRPKPTYLCVGACVKSRKKKQKGSSMAFNNSSCSISQMLLLC